MTKKGMLGFCVLAMIGCLAGCAKKENSYVEGVFWTMGIPFGFITMVQC